MLRRCLVLGQKRINKQVESQVLSAWSKTQVESQVLGAWSKTQVESQVLGAWCLGTKDQGLSTKDYRLSSRFLNAEFTSHRRGLSVLRWPIPETSVTGCVPLCEQIVFDSRRRGAHDARGYNRPASPLSSIP